MRRYRAGRFAALMVVNDECYLSNPHRNFVAEFTGASDVLNNVILFCATERTHDEILDWLEGRFTSQTAAERSLLQMEEAGLLVPSGESRAEEQGFEDDYDVCRYLGFSGTVKYVDYTDPVEARVLDMARMQKYEDESAAPPLSVSFSEAPRIRLPRPSTGSRIGVVEKISGLLFFGFGVQRFEGFWGRQTVALKCVPSQGARHPFEVYFECKSGDVFSRGIYHYDPLGHALELLSEDASSSGNHRLIITVCFERFQWRYRHSWKYKDLFHELGHIIATIKLAAEEFGLILEVQNAPTLSLNLVPLEEEVVAGFTLIIGNGNGSLNPS
jgi:SagB-type dehydrogenase family enzyme